MMTRIGVTSVIGFLLLAAGAPAQEATWPTRPVRIIAAAAPGGNPDIMARLIAARASEMLASPFFVENVPGVGGVLAAKQIAAVAPDGYSLMLNDTGAMAISIAMNPDANYRLADFTPITAVARAPTVLVAKPSLPARDVASFIALAKRKPNALSFGSAGSGSIHQITMLMFAREAGIELLHVPYRGGTGIVNGLLTGEIDAGWSGIANVLALIHSGKLRALCASVLHRDVSIPDVPTCDEAGIKGFDIATMLGLQFPAGVAPSIVARLQGAVAKILREPVVAERMVTFGIHLAENGTAAYARYMQEDLVRYTAVVADFHLRVK